EEVFLADGEDQSMAGYRYYVIIGGFSVPENAKKFKNELIGKGFTPVMLKAANGYTRVAVGETNSEPDARKQVLNIRQKFPEHNDVWLLRNK
ncbi:MAG TPA: SPOR domain-containing protein, partial [Prolixibacteraceae bacterium]|nr:SPOR domain-containing protein [Prolixibacteraceae bacterium]